ncbi:hypothetical protein CCP3SC15_4030005 [Gammaproteobacteria bacterium]
MTLNQAIEAFDRCAARWPAIFPGGSLTLVGYATEQSTDLPLLSYDSEWIFRWFERQVDAGFGPDDTAHLGMFPGVAIKAGEEPILSGGWAHVGWSKRPRFAVFVGSRVTKGRDPVQRAADLICHEAQHAMGLHNEQTIG